MAQSDVNIAADDAFYYVASDGTDSALYLFVDGNSDATADAGEVTLLGTFTGVDLQTLAAAQLADFV